MGHGQEKSDISRPLPSLYPPPADHAATINQK
jgi:hypothetical protein